LCWTRMETISSGAGLLDAAVLVVMVGLTSPTC
jgi:hypothetical protein